MNIDVKAACLSFTLFSLIAGLALAGLVSGDPFWADAPSQPTPIYIRSDGAIEPSSAPIQRSGSVYTFTGDALNSSLIVEADSIMVDGAGFLLQGNGRTGGYRDADNYYVGISLTNRTNVTIKNTIIKEFDFGVMVASSSGISLVGNQVYEITRICNASSNCQLTDNSLSRVEVQSGLNIITNNNFTLSHSYLSIGGNNNTVNENLFHTSIGVGPNAHNNTVSQNMIFSTGSSGIAISYGSSSHNEVFGNEISISGNWGGGVTRSSGVSISYCRENVIYNNTIRNADIGLYLCTTTNNLLYRNKMENVSENVVTEDTLTGELGFNSWDNGREGNYWSGYTGADADGDGVGDAPYVINENNIDHYPLMPYYEPDVTSPVVSFSSPEDKTYNDGNIELTFAANEPVSWVGYSLDGQDNVTIAGNTTLTDLRNGSHNVTVYATDLAGNTGASETLVFTVDLSEPFPTVPVAAAATSIIVVLAGFLVYFKKRKN